MMENTIFVLRSYSSGGDVIDVLIGVLFALLLGVPLVLFVLREFFCWYFKINETIRELKKTNSLLEKQVSSTLSSSARYQTVIEQMDQMINSYKEIEQETSHNLIDSQVTNSDSELSQFLSMNRTMMLDADLCKLIRGYCIFLEHLAQKASRDTKIKCYKTAKKYSQYVTTNVDADYSKPFKTAINAYDNWLKNLI